VSPLEEAVASLEAEVLAFGQGTKDQPEDLSRDFYLLRAKSLGLSYLRGASAGTISYESALRAMKS